MGLHWFSLNAERERDEEGEERRSCAAGRSAREPNMAPRERGERNQGVVDVE